VPAATAAAGSFRMTVGAANRTGNAPLRYTLMQSVGAYPQSYTGGDGGTNACPTADGGCGFNR